MSHYHTLFGGVNNEYDAMKQTWNATDIMAQPISEAIREKGNLC